MTSAESDQDAREALRRGFYEEFAALCAKYAGLSREHGFAEMDAWFREHARTYGEALQRMLSAARIRRGAAR